MNIKEIALEAFDLQDWLSGTMSGGIDAPRMLVDVVVVNETTVDITWRNQETCGLSDCRYHNTDLKLHTDRFTLNENILTMNDGEVFPVTSWGNDPDIMDKIEGFTQKHQILAM